MEAGKLAALCSSRTGYSSTTQISEKLVDCPLAGPAAVYDTSWQVAQGRWAKAYRGRAQRAFEAGTYYPLTSRRTSTFIVLSRFNRVSYNETRPMLMPETSLFRHGYALQRSWEVGRLYVK